MKLVRIDWPGPAPAAGLGGAGEVQVWIAGAIPDEATLARMALHLDPEERARAERFHRRADRDRFVFSRALLRERLAAYLGGAPAEVRFVYGRAGKPMLADRDGGRPPLVFNVTHTRELTLIALARDGELGIDAEPIQAGEAWAELAFRVLSGRERGELERLTPAVRPAAFLRAWTGKEALLKAVGLGLVNDLGALDLTLSPSEPVRLRAWKGGGELGSAWELGSFTPLPDHVATVAYREKPNARDHSVA